MTPDKFISALAPAAVASMKTTRIPASFTIAQAALESGWSLDAPGCNIFGIKADNSWHGAILEVPTHEVVNGKRIAITAKFRAYPDWQAAIDDHAKFLTENPRYSLCFSARTGCGFAHFCQAAGYATDPDYAAKICSIITHHQLDQYDA